MLVAVADIARRRRDRGETGDGVVVTQKILDIAVVLIVLIETVLAVDLDALKVLFQDEIDDARDRIGAVGGRCAARHHVDPLDQRRRNLVDVGRYVLIRGTGVTGAEAPAIDQHQGALGTQAAKIDGRETTGRGQGTRGIAEIGVGADDVLRQRIDAHP